MDEKEILNRFKNLYKKQTMEAWAYVDSVTDIDDLIVYLYGESKVAIKRFSVLKNYASDRKKILNECHELEAKLKG